MRNSAKKRIACLHRSDLRVVRTIFRVSFPAVSNNAFATSRLDAHLRRQGAKPTDVFPVHVIVNRMENSDAVVVELVEVEQQTRQDREERLIDQAQANKELIRNLAHEIKNPLGGIRGAAQLLELELPPHHLLEQRSRQAEQRMAPVAARPVGAALVEPDTGPVGGHGAPRLELLLDAREPVVQRVETGRQEHVQVTPLGHVAARPRGILEPFPLQHDHLVDVVGQRPRGQQPPDAGPDDDHGRHRVIVTDPTRLG